MSGSAARGHDEAAQPVSSPRLVLCCLGPPALVFVASQVLTNFTDVLNHFAFGAVSWALLIAVGQLVLAVAAGFVYTRLVERRPGERP